MLLAYRFLYTFSKMCLLVESEQIRNEHSLAVIFKVE